MQNLVVYSRLDGSEACHMQLGKTGAPIGGVRAGLPPRPARQGQGQRCTWLVRGEDVLLTRSRLALRNAALLQRALPYALEDEVAAEVDSLVFGQRRDAEGLGVVIADRARLAEGQAVLAEVGLRVRRILPDVLALPLEPDAWSLAIESGRALLRTGPSSGFVCEVASLDWSLAQAWHTTPEAQRPRRLLASGMDAEAVALPAEDLEVVDLAGELLPLLGQAADRAGGGVELPLADARPLAAGSRVRWALAAGCVLLGLGLATASLWWEGRGLAMANAGLQQEIESVFTTSFPGRRVQDARLQMQQEIDALESASAAGNSLLPLLAVLAGAFDKERQLRLELLEYRQGQLLVRLRARDVAQLERVKRTLERDAGNKVGIGAVNAGGDHVTAQLRIGRVAA